ncbi:ATP-grasp fold amidoligase family protein [Winogradskyella pacifica]|uniref:ATP-grasp fold amidoligase family protein n=1 Tax=Winogradskyella pacifica TaxID=664642 RepID=UPI0015CDE1A5|nr:ATP-grasp fold amidoligase family protein [Winogradskyella pacifica]
MKNLRKTISNIYRNSDLGYNILRPFYKIYELGLSLISDEYIVKRSFKKHLGYSIDLNNPQTLNEKINWLKLYNRKDLHTVIADKFKVRAYIKEKIGEEYLIPLLYHTVTPKDIRPENLPDTSFIIKANHDSSGGVIVRDKSKVEWNIVRSHLRKALSENHYLSTREWQYKNIRPRIIVEKLLTYDDGSIPYDYKFHCFNGKVAFLGVDIGRFSEQRTRNLYDTKWNLLPCNWGRPNGVDVAKPTNFEEMKTLAEKIAEDFTYIRVDFYAVNGKTYFGELTLHHSSGFRKFDQEECDQKLGKLLNIDYQKTKRESN